MQSKISVVINTLNEGELLTRAIKSVDWADEVLVCDMHSTDKSAEIAKKMGAKIVFHEKLDYVEPARNFAISKASGDWILIMDPDEEIPDSLARKLQEITKENSGVDFVEISRKNIIFGKWMKASMWWPDYNIRFFKKGSVSWGDMIHQPPKTTGSGIKLEANEQSAISHYHYDSASQFIERMNRYTTIQANELIKKGEHLKWQDLIKKPLSEFLSRFFAHRGFDDGLHGLALSLLQALSFVVVYLKIWEADKFTEQEIGWDELKKTNKKVGGEISYWLKYANLSKNPIRRFAQKFKNKFS